MKKIVVFLVLGIAVVCDVNSAWKFTAVTAANYSETSVSDNWSGGESDSKNWMLAGDASIENDMDRSNWLNSMKLEYGKASISGSAEQENVDQIYLNSIYKYKLGVLLNPYAAFNADAQFTEFFDPAEYTESAGISYNVLVSDRQSLTTRAGIALKQTALTYAENDSETGAEWISNYDVKINENVKFVSEFKTFTGFDAGADIRWDNSLYVKMGKYLTAQVGYLAIHDYDAEMPRPDLPDDIQTRLTFGLGFSYNIF